MSRECWCGHDEASHDFAQGGFCTRQGCRCAGFAPASDLSGRPATDPPTFWDHQIVGWLPCCSGPILDHGIKFHFDACLAQRGIPDGAILVDLRAPGVLDRMAQAVWPWLYEPHARDHYSAAVYEEKARKMEAALRSVAEGTV